jgi:long-chain acyl-CoA synthetase
MNIAKRIEEVAAEKLEKTAFIAGERRVSFREFDAMASRVAGGLRSAGVAEGDRVAVMAGSHPEFVAAMVGAWKAGAIFVALNAQLAPEEVRYQLSNCEPRVVIADPGRSHEIVASAAREIGSVERVALMGEVSGDPFAAVGLPDSSDATIFYTSGTTGVPKGATHTHRALLVQVEQVCERYGVTSEDQFLSTLPIYLLSISTCGPLSSLLSGATCRLMSRYDPVDFAAAVRKDRTTVIASSVPLMYADLLELPPEDAEKVDLSTVRVATCGGSPMAPEVRRAFEERYGFRFVHAYGGTEGPGIVSTDPMDGRERKFDSVGVPLPHIKVTIKDEDGNQVPTGELGEICTSAYQEGPYAGYYEPVNRYWGMPDETERAVRGGELHWGDLGRLDEDGYLYMVDRKKDMIIRGGMNVYPKELERLLYEDDRIAECAVVGAPHDRYGEVPVAFVRLTENGEATEEEVVSLVNDRTAKFKHLQEVIFVEDFPRNALGKVLKRDLRAGINKSNDTSVAASAKI